MVTIINITIGAHLITPWPWSNVCRSAPNEDGERARDILGLPEEVEDIRARVLHKRECAFIPDEEGREEDLLCE